MFSCRIGWDHRYGSGRLDGLTQGAAVIGAGGNDISAGGARDEGFSLRDVAALSGCDDEAQRSSERIGEHVDFGGQSSSGAPQSLVLVPPFPVAACWWARTSVVSSMRYSFLRSLVRTSNTRSHTPVLAQRAKRVCTLFHLPYRGGRS